MADDIVTQLRRIAVTQRDCPICGTATAAADEIERLHAEINDLRLRLVALSIPKDTRRG